MKKMVNIISHQGNVRQIHNEMLFHTNKKDYNKKR